MSKKWMSPKIIDWFLIGAAVILLIGFCIPHVLADPLGRQDRNSWYLGEGLSIGDSFRYKICDSILRIPHSPDSCYIITLHFLQLLPSPEGNTWITSARVNHNNRQVEMIFHVLDDSFKIKTDKTTVPYAQSIERTLGWLEQYASKFKPQLLVVGRSWGVVASDTTPIELLVTQVDSLHLDNQTHKTHKLGYYLVKDSFVQIKDGFPFPIHAVIYKPVFSYGDPPLAFTIELLSYNNSDLCYAPLFDEKMPTPNDSVQYEDASNIISPYDETLDDDSNDVFSILSTEEEVALIEGHQNNENHTKSNLTMNYKELDQFLGDLTGLLELLTEGVNHIENQTKS